MKKIVFILSLFLVTTNVLMAQEDGEEKIRDRMREYIQERMKLSNDEADKFAPVFLRYFKEWRTTLRENKQDKLILQQKIVELKLRYRTEFRNIVGEKRSNEVFVQQEKFLRELNNIRRERILDRTKPRNGIKALQF